MLGNTGLFLKNAMQKLIQEVIKTLSESGKS